MGSDFSGLRSRVGGETGVAYSVITRTQQSAIAGDGHAGDGDVFLRDELVGAFVLAQVPDADIPPAIARDQLPLIRMNDHIVDGSDMSDQVSHRGAVDVVALDAACSRIPHFHRAIFGARHHPFALTVECHTGDVARMTIEGEDRVRIGGADIVELHIVISGRGQVAFVRGDT